MTTPNTPWPLDPRETRCPRWIRVPGFPPGHHLNIDGLHAYEEFCLRLGDEPRIRLRVLFNLN